jgi:hypothetical protein
MFVVKRLGRNGMWNAVSLIDENGSFRGEAKFETREQADEYLEIYVRRMKDRLRGTNASDLRVKVFDDSTPDVQAVEPEKPREPKKVKKKPAKKKKPRK